MTADSARPLRADARRNRDQILAAARRVFGALGPDVPMEEIARQAGVGVGTLYRRFPDRTSLILAVAQESFTQVLAGARAAVAEEASAWNTLVRLLHTSGELRLGIQLTILSPLAARAIEQDPETTRFQRDLLAILDEVVRAAQTEGTLRPDVGTGDVAALLSLLLRPMHAVPDTTARQVSERATALLLDCLRAPSRSPLPGTPLTVEQLKPGVGRDSGPRSGGS
ncbi:TetR/AcrR family transcriptional regulator [Streptomyces sp. NPDC093085]|uniref:TetR/AcrR family transcriptional regulator n=1 Tax=Streptomyces sp. NPDC093085 TaxID=3155068 RepID=UPI00342BA68A